MDQVLKHNRRYQRSPNQSSRLHSYSCTHSSVRRRESQATSAIRHNIERETPLPIYIGLMIHTKTRKRELVDDLYELGLSISYNRVLNILTELGNKVCHHYKMERAASLKGGLFTTGAVDNIDHDPSSTSAWLFPWNRNISVSASGPINLLLEVCIYAWRRLTLSTNKN